MLPQFLKQILVSRSVLPRSLVALSLLTLVTGCGVKGSGVLVEEDHTLESYDSIVLEDGFSGRVVMGDEFSVEIRADDNLVQYVRVVQSGTSVTVDLGDQPYQDATLEAVFTLPRLAELHVTDGSSVEGVELVTSETVELLAQDGAHIDASFSKESTLSTLHVSAEDGSHITCDAAAEDTWVDAADGSQIAMTGETDTLSIDLEDGSSLSARSFESVLLFFSLSDGSTADVFATNEAEGELNDGSSLNVYGGAAVKAQVRDGSSLNQY